MSRTFELLQRTGKSRSLFEETAPASEARSDGPSETWAEPSPSNAGARRLRLDIEGVGREESLKFVRRVFLSQEADTARCTVFSGVERAVGTTWNCVCAARTLATKFPSSCSSPLFWSREFGRLGLGVNTVRSSFQLLASTRRYEFVVVTQRCGDV